MASSSTGLDELPAELKIMMVENLETPEPQLDGSALCIEHRENSKCPFGSDVPPLSFWHGPQTLRWMKLHLDSRQGS
jgi:hypothetical protein